MLPSDMRAEIGQRIKQFRIQNEFNQTELANAMEISVNFLSEIENGKKGFSAETLYKFCDRYDISADYILFGKTADSFSEKDMIDIAGRLGNEQLDIVIDYLKALKDMRNIK